MANVLVSEENKLWPRFHRNQMWTYFGPAFLASVAYIDPGKFATHILGGFQYVCLRLWLLLWWVAGEVSAIATDLAEFLGAALGFYLLFGPATLAHGWSRTETLFGAAFVTAVGVFLILALDLAGYRWFERCIMAFVGIIGLCYGFEVFLVHPDWRLAAFHALVPTLDPGDFHGSLYAAVGMLGATVMPHVVYLHSALVQPRRAELIKQPMVEGASRRRSYLRFELIDVFVAMNGAWLINSAMVGMGARAV